MISLLILATIPALGSTAVVAPHARQETAQEAKNREFIVKNYPPGALKRGEQGRVAFRITIEPDGSLGGCDVTESSGFAGLDAETCEIMVFNARLKPVLNQEGQAIRAKQNGFIVWRLPGSPDAVAESTAKTMPKPDEIICKKQAKTGSLVATTKQCMTKTEWAQTEQVWKHEMDRLQFRGYCDSNCTPEFLGDGRAQRGGGGPQ